MKTYAKIAAALIAGFLISSTTVFAQSSNSRNSKQRFARIKKPNKKLVRKTVKTKGKKAIKTWQGRTQLVRPKQTRPKLVGPGIIKPGVIKPNFPTVKPKVVQPKILKPRIKVAPKVLVQPAVGGGNGQRFFVQPSPSVPAVSLGFTGVLTSQGLRVISVACGSHAHRIGLESGDVITHIDGQRFYTYARFQEILSHVIMDHGGRLTLRIRNVRHNWDPWQPKFVNRVYFLPVWGPPVVPAGPVAINF